jgi:hypothetical protein
VVSRAFEGSVYRLNFKPEVLAMASEEPPKVPEWVDQSRWSMTPETYQRLLARAGSNERAADALLTITYNETHGPPTSRVRSRRAVLAAYLNGHEVFPNDDSFEAWHMSVKLAQARRDEERSRQERETQRQAQRTKVLAGLTGAQRAELRDEAKRRVDATVPDFVRNREPLYREEEERLVDQVIP